MRWMEYVGEMWAKGEQEMEYQETILSDFDRMSSDSETKHRHKSILQSSESQIECQKD